MLVILGVLIVAGRIAKGYLDTPPEDREEGALFYSSRGRGRNREIPMWCVVLGVVCGGYRLKVKSVWRWRF